MVAFVALSRLRPILREMKLSQQLADDQMQIFIAGQMMLLHLAELRPPSSGQMGRDYEVRVRGGKLVSSRSWKTS